MILLRLIARAYVFLLASASFVVLLGAFYGHWMMSEAVLYGVLPSIGLLILVAAGDRGDRPRDPARPSTWVVEGALGGLVAAIAYDLFRLPFVLNGYPLFDVMPKFAVMIFGESAPREQLLLAGWAYHFLNGMALGVMLLALWPAKWIRWIILGGIVWALAVEAILLASPYAEKLGLEMNQTFIILTASAHLVFGIVLGVWLRLRFRGLKRVN